MRIELQLPCFGLAALLLAPGCAARTSAGTSAPAWSESGDGSPTGALSLTDAEQADQDCADQVREHRRRICDDAPPVLPESYGERSRAAFVGLEERCGAGMRACAALRELDDCLFAIEQDGSQIDARTQARREEAASTVASLQQDPLYPRARRRLEQARQEADLAAKAYEEELPGRSESRVRFRADAWEQAESDLRSAQRQMLKLLTAHGVDPRDARALGVW